MAGHSKWSNIKHAKAAEDAKRSQVFLKFSREIAVAVRTGGGPNPNENSKLASLMEKARVASVPKVR
jgi:transcriptional/translational regulatory protein YebC/TACO1